MLKKFMAVLLITTMIATISIPMFSNQVSASEPVSFTLQQGVDGYAGCKDQDAIVWWDSCGRGAADILRLPGSVYNALIYFNLSAQNIPSNAIIDSASLTLNYYNANAGSVNLYRIIDPDNKGMWREGTNTDWNTRDGVSYFFRDSTDSNQWTNTVGSDITNSIASSATGSISFQGNWGSSMIPTTSSSLTADVQSWVSGATVNQGWFLSTAGLSCYADIASKENATVSYRPALTVTYHIDPNATPIPTPSATPVSSPTITPTVSPTPTPTATPIASPTNTPTPTAVSDLLVIDDNSTGTGLFHFNYGPTEWNWNLWGNNPYGDYMATCHNSKTEGSTAQLTFIGDQISIYGWKGIDNGIFGLTIDSGTEEIIDCAGPGCDVTNQLLYSSPVLSNGQHTVVIRVTGTTSNRNSYIIIDKAVIHTDGTVQIPTPGPTGGTPTPTPIPTIPPGATNPPALPAITPELPRIWLDSTYSEPTGNIINVNSGDNLQVALNNAKPGDTLILQAGATFTGNYTLPTKTGDDWIYIKSSAYANLPSPGNRVSWKDASNMAKIISSNSAPAISVGLAAHNYRLIGLEVISTADRSYGMISFDAPGGNTDIANIAHDFVVDRCYIHGLPDKNSIRGISLNCASASVIDSYISEIHDSLGADCQGLCAWNGPGPLKIDNNFISASTENIIFGGDKSASADFIPSDIQVTRNHLYKPLSWYANDPSYDGSHWLVKNLFELKVAKRVYVNGNVMENNWANGQSGYAVLFTVRDEDYSSANTNCTWAEVSDITFTNNIIAHSAGGFAMHGYDNIKPSQQSKRFLIENNLIYDIDSVKYGAMNYSWSGDAIFLIGNNGGPGTNGILGLNINHNTVQHEIYPYSSENGSNTSILCADSPSGSVATQFYFTNNIFSNSSFWGSSYGPTKAVLDRYFSPDWVWDRNILPGGNPAVWPNGTYCPPTFASCQFVDPAARDYHLSASSPYKNMASDGTDIGANIDTINTATDGVVIAGDTDPIPTPAQTPTPTPAPTNGQDADYDYSFAASNRGGNLNQYALSNGTPATIYGVATENWANYGGYLCTNRGSTDTYVAFKFQGSKIKLYVEAAPYCGIAAVSILDQNGNILVPEQDVDCYAPQTQYSSEQLVYTSPNLPENIYTLKIRITTRVNPANIYVNDGKNPPTQPYWTINLGKVTVTSCGIIASPTSTPIPTATSAPTATPAPTPMLGDVTGDGQITPADALKVLHAVTGKIVLTDAQKVVADVTKNGKVQATDALKILQYCSGKISSF